MLTKGAIGNLVNRYRAVLTKCNLINTFGSLAVASMLVLGGAGVAMAAEITDGGKTRYAEIIESSATGINVNIETSKIGPQYDRAFAIFAQNNDISINGDAQIGMTLTDTQSARVIRAANGKNLTIEGNTTITASQEGDGYLVGVLANDGSTINLQKM